MRRVVCGFQLVGCSSSIPGQPRRLEAQARIVVAPQKPESVRRVSNKVSSLAHLQPLKGNTAGVLNGVPVHVPDRCLGTAVDALLITRPTGVGKTFLACALTHAAVRRGHSALYVRSPRLLAELALSRGDVVLEKQHA